MTDKQQIDLGVESIGDSGEVSQDSIKPLSNSEIFGARALNRQPNLIRHRIEQVRKEINRINWITEAERGPYIATVRNGEISWDGSKLTMNNPNGNTDPVLTITSMLRPGKTDSRPNEDSSRDSYTKFATLDKAHPSHSSNTLKFISLRFAYEGGNEISVKAVQNDSDVNENDVPDLYLNGNSVTNRSEQPGRDNIRIEYHSNHNIQDVIDAFDPNSYNTVPPAVNELQVTYDGDTTHTMFDFDETKLDGGFDGVRFKLSAPALDSFFTTTSNELSKEWDTLAISMSSVQSRREYVGSNVTVTEQDLVNLSEEPHKSSDAIPICTIESDGSSTYAVMANGVVIDEGTSKSTLKLNASQLRSDLWQPSGSNDPPTPGVASGESGADRILVQDSVFGIISASGPSSGYILSNVLDEIDNLLDTHDTDISNNQSNISSLDSRVTSAENAVSDLQNDVTTLQDITYPGEGTPIVGSTAYNAVVSGLNLLASNSDYDQKKFTLRVRVPDHITEHRGPFPDVSVDALDEHPRGLAYDNITAVTLEHDASNNTETVNQWTVEELSGSLAINQKNSLDVTSSDYVASVLDTAMDGNYYFVSYAVEDGNGNPAGGFVRKIEQDNNGVLDGSNRQTIVYSSGTDLLPYAMVSDGDSLFLVYENDGSGKFTVEERDANDITNVLSSADFAGKDTSNAAKVTPVELEIYDGTILGVVEEGGQPPWTISADSNLSANGFDANTTAGVLKNVDYDDYWITNRAIYATFHDDSGGSNPTLQTYFLDPLSPGSVDKDNETEVFIPASKWHVADIAFDQENLYMITIDTSGGNSQGSAYLTKFDRYTLMGTRVRTFLESDQPLESHSFYSDDSPYYDVHVVTNGIHVMTTTTDVSVSPNESRIVKMATGELQKDYIYHGYGSVSVNRPRYRAITEV